MTWDIEDLQNFKDRFVASDYKLTLTGSYESDELHYPGFYDEVFLLIAIDSHEEDRVRGILDNAQSAWQTMHGARK